MTNPRPQDPKFFDFFWELSSVESTVRNKAAIALVQTLVTRQKDFHSTDPQQLYCPELAYSITRLVRGLASNREGARQGFVLALTEILRYIEYVNTQDIVNEILKNHALKGSTVKRAEEKEKLLGIVFGVAALLRSGRLVQILNNDQSKEKTMNNMIIPLLKELNAAIQKEITAEVATKVFVSVLELITKEDFAQYILPLLTPHFTVSPENFSPEHLLIALYISKHFEFDITTVNTQWTHRSLIHPEHSQYLVHILKPSLSRASHVHCIWEHILNHIQTSNDPSFALQSFWNNVMDELLKSRGIPSKANALQVFQMFASSITPQQIPLLLTSTLVSLLIRSLTSKSHPLNRPAKRALEAIVAVAQKSSPIAFGVAVTLQKRLPHFDNATHTKTIQNLMQSVKLEDAKEHIASVVQLFYKHNVESLVYSSRSDESDDDDDDNDNDDMAKDNDDDAVERTVEKSRLALLDQLIALARVTSSFHNKLEYALSLLKFLFFHSYFTMKDEVEESDESDELLKLKKKFQPPLTETVRKACRERFTTLLSFLSTHYFELPSNDLQTDIETNVTPPVKKKKRETEERALKNSIYWANCVVKFQRKLRRDKTVTRRIKLSESETAVEKEAMKIVKSIQKELKNISTENADNETKERQNQLLAFQLLFLHMILHLNEDPKESTEILQDLFQCYKRFFKMESNGQSDEPKPMIVLNDVFCSLLLKESSIFRNVVQKVFAVFSNHLNEESFFVLIDAFSNPKAVVVEEEVDTSSLVDDENESEKADNDNASKINSSTKNQFNAKKSVQNEKTDKIETNDEDHNENNSDDSPSHEDNAMSIDENETEKKQTQKEQESVNESELSADDDEMFELEKHIAVALKERKEVKAAKKKMLTQITHFRFKVFGLIEIFAKKHPGSPLLLNVYPPFGEAASELISNKGPRGTLANKLIDFISRQRLLRLVSEETKAHEILEKLFKVVQKATNRKVAVAIANSICSIVKSLMKIEKDEFGALNVEKFSALFETAYTHFTTHKTSPYYAEFFRVILKQNPRLGWKLLPKVFQLSAQAVTPYIYLDNLSHIKELLQNKKIKELYKEHFDEAASLFKVSLLSFFERQTQNKSKATAKPKILLKIITMTTEIVKQLIDTISLQEVQKLLEHNTVLKSLESLQQKISEKPKSLNVAVHQLTTLLQEGEIKSIPKQKKTKPNPKEQSTQEEMAVEKDNQKKKKHKKSKNIEQTDNKDNQE